MAFQARGRDPLFDSNMQAAIEKRGKELIGFALITAGLMVGAMIASYSPDDPNFLAATDGPVHNWLGRMGASIAAPLFMIVGRGAWALAVVLLVWGLRFALHRGEERLTPAFIFSPIWVAMVSVYCAGQSVAAGWPHSFGYGGLFGDMMMGSLLTLMPFGTGANLIVAMVALAVGGLVMGAFVLGSSAPELRQIARFLTVGVTMVYATVM